MPWLRHTRGAGTMAPRPGIISRPTGKPSTATPIKHLVVIFQENVSFDHYFATYPDTSPASGDQPFRARSDTPSVNGLNTPLLAPNNPNSAQPFLLHHSQAYTCDQDHDYTAEQPAFDAGLMDQFVDSLMACVLEIVASFAGRYGSERSGRAGGAGEELFVPPPCAETPSVC